MVRSSPFVLVLSWFGLWQSQRLRAVCDPAHELTSRTPPSAFAIYPCTVHCRPQRHPRPAGWNGLPGAWSWKRRHVGGGFEL